MRILAICYLMVIVIAAFVSCTKKRFDKQKPDDFSFRYEDATDSYDSRSGIYTRQYMLKKDSSVSVVLSEEELNLIYDLFKKVTF